MKAREMFLRAESSEDPDSDVRALEISDADRVLTVTGAGGIALTCLAQGAEVVAVDADPARNHFLELKLRAIRSLPVQSFRRFMGVRKGAERVWTYRALSHLLSPEARSYWDARLSEIERGLLRSEMPYPQRLLLGWNHPPSVYRQLLRLRDPAEKKLFHERRWNTGRWKSIVARANLCRPAFGPLFTLAGGEPFVQKIAKRFYDIPFRDNYFMSLAFLGRFLPGEAGIPPYFRQDIYSRIREQAARLRWVTGDIVDFMSIFPESSFTKIVLSNVMEGKSPERLKNALHTTAKVLEPGGKILLRWITPRKEAFGAPGLRENKELSDQMSAGERTGLYSRVMVCEKDNVPR